MNYREGKGYAGYELSWHARQRKVEMKLRERDIRRTITDCSTSYPSEHGCVTYQKGPIAVIVNEAKKKIVTIVWNRRDEWTRDETRTAR